MLHKMHLEEAFEKNCTFQPQSSESALGRASPLQQEYLFSRLYRDGEKRQQHKQQLQEIKHLQEIEKCTFKPELVAAKSPNQQSERPAHQRLFEDAVRASHNKIKAQIEHENEVMQALPFKPAREATRGRDASVKRETSMQRS